MKAFSRWMRALLAMIVIAASPNVALAQASEAELDQLLAPVALYPDALLGNVLAASTYPLEVVELQRWLDRNPGLSPAEIDQAVASQPWDPSVKALAPFRGVVAMMSGELEWTRRLGNAFLAGEADVMEAVQRLRRNARAAGSLEDNDRERIVVERDYIAIEPAQPELVYVPVYDPRVVYGGWWWPDYPPYVWSGFYFGPWDYVAGSIAFGTGIHVWRTWHAYSRHPDWRQRNLIERRPGGHTAWRHDPRHRIGVPYADNRSHERYRPADRDRIHDRRDFRGFDVRPGVQSRIVQPRFAQPQVQPRIARPQAQPRIAQPQAQPRIAQPHVVQPHALRPAPSPVARAQSERGHQSLAAPSGNPVARASRDKR